MEVVQADKQPFMAATGFVEASLELSPIKFTSKRKDGIPRKKYMDSKGYVEIRNEVAKFLKVTTIMPYRPMIGPIIEKIDEDLLLSRRKGSSCNFHIQNESAANCGKN